MRRLQPAGFLGRILTALLPRKLEVQVHASVEADGTMILAPACLVAGQEVNPVLVHAAARQQILGYSIVADDDALAIVRRGPLRLTKGQAARQLRDLTRRGIPVRDRETGTPIAVREVQPRVTLTPTPAESLDVDSQLVITDGGAVPKPADLDQLRRDEGWYMAEGNLLHVPLTNTEWDAVLVAAGGDGHLSGAAVPRFLKALGRFPEHFCIAQPSAALQATPVYGEQRENRVLVDGDADSIALFPRLVCLGKNRQEYELSLDDLVLLERQDGCRQVAGGWIALDAGQIGEYRDALQELVRRIGQLAPVQGLRIPETLRTLVEQERFTSSWTVSLAETVKALHRLVDSPAEVEFRLQVIEDPRRCALEIVPEYNYGRFAVTHAEHSAAAARGVSWIRRPNAWIRLDHAACQRVASTIERLGLQPGPAGFAFAAAQRETVLEALAPLGHLDHSPAYEAFLGQMAVIERIVDVPLPATLRPGITLRPYQKQGFNWLAFLQRFGLNGILADDMGLGKTLQTLAMLQRAKEQGPGNAPSLIICPTSVMGNWKSEAEKFFTHCPVMLYTGGDRKSLRQSIRQRLKRPAESLAGPLVVTSYDVARRDCKELKRIPWLYVVVDEGHNIKNPDAKRTKAIKAIPGRHKLALTGTPIQNKLEELWSLFDFAMPGFLGTRRAFRNRYARYDQVDWDAVRQGPGNLKDRIHPFILRRLKESVAQDLPPKIVVDQKVDLSPLQADLYRRVLSSADYRWVLSEIEAKGVRRSKMLILKVYTLLRSICNHPALAPAEYGGGGGNYDDSGKLACLKELMEEIVAGEHRALLFCQSTRMLDMIERCFGQWQHTWLRLDGNTPPPLRPELVQRFNAEESVRCFLISTRAGGTGLNLTGADTVIFFDHDWNPANDSQAQDRAYRIGQTRPVTVYRLISQGTIEEKILQRQAAKQTLADEVIDGDEEGFKDLDPAELLGLFPLDDRQAA